MTPLVTETANHLSVSGPFNVRQPYTDLQMEDGRIVRLPTALLVDSSTEAYTPAGQEGDTGPIRIPLVEEQLIVGKRTVETGTVRLDKTVHEYHEALDEPLAVRTFDIERILMDQPVEAAPSVRQEGDTTIYPLVEERLVLTKQLILKEEVRVTRRDTERRDTRVVTLRREHLTVERLPTQGQTPRVD